mmetsp:Transcript_122471/g.183110  ORF Transcript_122471/g.183110 Transcript_122471/m.183110 type:complete len:309 (+) Transcript_122471:1276-2202(+)
MAPTSPAGLKGGSGGGSSTAAVARRVTPATSILAFVTPAKAEAWWLRKAQSFVRWKAENANCCMASLPVTISAAKIPNTQIMANRPLLISLLRMSSVYIFTPKGSPKLPGSFPSCSRHASSMTADAMNRPSMPKTPSPVAIAPKPAGVFSKPGNLRKCWPSRPTEAIMATRPCFSSAARNLLNPPSSPTLQNPRGSKYPSGAKAPTSLAGLNGGGGGGSDSVALAEALVGVRPVVFRAAAAPAPASARPNNAQGLATACEDMLDTGVLSVAVRPVYCCCRPRRWTPGAAKSCAPPMPPTARSPRPRPR